MPQPAAPEETSQVRVASSSESRLVVTQANALAQGIQAMDLYEARLVRTLIAVLDRYDSEFPTVRLYVPDLCRLFGITNSNSVHDKLRRATKSVMSKVALVESGHGSWKAFNWIALAEYVSGRDAPDGVGYLEMQLHGQLKAFLLELKAHFFSYPLRHVTQMRSEYAIRLFELLLADSLSGKRRVLQYDVDDLRKRLSAEHYVDFKDFRKNVLELSQRECERVTNLRFEFEKVTRGRRVVAVEFTISLGANRDDAVLAVGIDETEEDLVQRVALQNELVGAGFSGSPGRYLDELGVERVRGVLSRCLQDATRLAGTKNAIRNLGAYVRSQLDREVDASASLGGVDEGGVGETLGASRLTLAMVARRADELYQAWAAACATFEAEAWAALGEEKQRPLEAVMRTILSSFQVRQLDAQGWPSSSPILAAARRDAMAHVGALAYPAHLQDLGEFDAARELLVDLSEEDRARVLRDARERYH